MSLVLLLSGGNILIIAVLLATMYLFVYYGDLLRIHLFRVDLKEIKSILFLYINN